MEPFAHPGAGEMWLAAVRPPVARWLLRRVGLAAHSAVTNAEVDSYFTLMRRTDGGLAFLRIMRGFDLTPQRQRLHYQGLGSRPYPAQVVWSADDRMLGADRMREAMEAVRVGTCLTMPGRHFFQEDQAPAIASAVAALARSG